MSKSNPSYYWLTAIIVHVPIHIRENKGLYYTLYSLFFFFSFSFFLFFASLRELSQNQNHGIPIQNIETMNATLFPHYLKVRCEGLILFIHVNLPIFIFNYTPSNYMYYINTFLSRLKPIHQLIFSSLSLFPDGISLKY